MYKLIFRCMNEYYLATMWHIYRSSTSDCGGPLLANSCDSWSSTDRHKVSPLSAQDMSLVSISPRAELVSDCSVVAWLHSSVNITSKVCTIAARTAMKGDTWM